MAIVHARVNCIRCAKMVDKSETILLPSTGNDKKFICFGCYKAEKPRTPRWSMGQETKAKDEYFCGRCKYKFKSVNPSCPYCSQTDAVVKGNITMKDLL